MLISGDMTTEREVYIEFLQLYRDFPCLWDQSSKQYSNRDAKNQALEILLDKLKQIDKDATIATVKKRLENMRTSYKRELKKVQDSKTTGSGMTDIYIPTLWYFEHLKFLNEKTVPSRDGVDTLDDAEEAETNTEAFKPPTTKRRLSLAKKQEQMIDTAQKLLSGDDNPAELYGRSLAFQLNEMSKIQRCIAEKLISEIVFYGKLEKLTYNSSIVLDKIDYSSPLPSPVSPSSTSQPSWHAHSPHQFSHPSSPAQSQHQFSQPPSPAESHHLYSQSSSAHINYSPSPAQLPHVFNQTSSEQSPREYIPIRSPGRSPHQLSQPSSPPSQTIPAQSSHHFIRLTSHSQSQSFLNQIHSSPSQLPEVNKNTLSQSDSSHEKGNLGEFLNFKTQY